MESDTKVRLFKELNCIGMDPVKLFTASWRKLRDVHLPREAGMLPRNKLL